MLKILNQSNIQPQNEIRSYRKEPSIVIEKRDETIPTIEKIENV